jgi:hypothetical protein
MLALLLTLGLSASAADTPLCPEMTAAHYQSQAQKCMDAAALSKTYKAEEIRKACECAAQEIVYKRTCQQIDRMKKDANYEMREIEKVRAKCLKHVPGAKPAA